MKLSKQIEVKLDRIAKTIEEGYRLERLKDFAIPTLFNKEGRRVRLIFAGPAGFSISGFFFSSIFCTQMKEYSYFLIFGVLSFIGAIATSLGVPIISTLLDFSFWIAYGFYYPYLRFINREQKKENLSLIKALIYSIGLGFIAITPAMLIGLITAT